VALEHRLLDSLGQLLSRNSFGGRHLTADAEAWLFFFEKPRAFDRDSVREFQLQMVAQEFVDSNPASVHLDSFRPSANFDQALLQLLDFSRRFTEPPFTFLAAGDVLKLRNEKQGSPFSSRTSETLSSTQTIAPLLW
jgi:hypothetical protein